MDLRSIISDLQKIRIVNTQFQTKLGEITLQLNNFNSNTQLLQNSSKELVLLFIRVLQGFLCHNHYIDYVSQKTTCRGAIPYNVNLKQEINEKDNNNSVSPQSSSVYDNSMNLILVISAKLSKLDQSYGKCIIDCFNEHISSHVDCFNYIISFYRLYISSSQIKTTGKDCGLYNYLFELYKKIYVISLKYESSENSNRMKDLESLSRINKSDMISDKKFFLENYKRQEASKEKNAQNVSSAQEMSANPKTAGANFNSRISSNSNEKESSKFTIFNSFKISHTQNFSKTDRSNVHAQNLKHLSNDYQQKAEDGISFDTQSKFFPKDLRESISKKKIPELKFPVNNIEHHFSLSRSSQRNDFSKSGGSSTNHTKTLKDKTHTKQNPSRKEIAVDGLSSNNRPLDLDNDEGSASPINKLKTLAFQLGESCLASDLASLINQKRDLELGKIAKEKMSKKTSPLTSNDYNKRANLSESSYIDKLKNNGSFDGEVEKNEVGEGDNVDVDKNTLTNKMNNPSTNTFYSNQNQLKNLLNQKPLIKTSQNVDNINKDSTSQNNLNDFTKDFKRNFVFSFDNQMGNDKADKADKTDKTDRLDKAYRNYIKIREIVSNFILSCLREFSLDEFHLLKINVNVIYSFLLLPSFDQIRLKITQKKSENLEHMQVYSTDLQAITSEGSYLATESKENLFKTILLNSVDKSEDLMRSARQNFVSKEKASFDSFLSINFEEDKSTSLALKSEFEALYEILSFNSSSLEHILKQQNFYKSIFYSLENPEPENAEFWSGGVLFNMFSKMTKESVRKHSDVFLERMKNRITYILKTYSMQNNVHIWKTLKQQFDIMRDYISLCKSKVIPIHFVFELSEILIILKKNFISLFTKLGPFEVTKNEIKLIENSDYSDVEIPDEVIDLFTSYLDVLSNIIVNTEIFTCEKLLNDMFIVCPSFIEIVKFTVLYIFTKDISIKPEKQMQMMSSNRNSSADNLSNNRTKRIRYTLLNFIKEADGITETSSNLQKVYENYKEYLQMALLVINYLHNSSVFYLKIIRKENLDKSKNEEKQASKFWVNSIREYMRFLNVFVNSKYGIFYEYFINYGSLIVIHNNQLIKDNEKHNPVINFALTRALLNLQHSVFEFGHKFSFIVNENTSLDLIRVHYISFIKLYNKNLDFKKKLGDMNKILKNCDQKKKKIKALIRDIYNDQSHIQVIVDLCKLHLMCLLSLAKNRNVDVTNKFFQLRIVDFMTKELDLEHEATEKLHKMKCYISKNSLSDGNINLSANFKDLKLNRPNKGNMNLTPNINIKDSNTSNNPFDDKKMKEEILKKKYQSKQESVIEVGEEDMSKISYNKKFVNTNPNLCFNKETSLDEVEIESFDGKKANSSNADQKINKNVIIEHIEIDNDSSVYEDEEIDDDEYGSDLSDVMLVELKPKVNPYEDKIPKLSLIPTTFSESTLGGAAAQNQQQKPQTKPSLKLNFLPLNAKPVTNLAVSKSVKIDINETEEDRIKVTELFLNPDKITNLKQTIGVNNQNNQNNKSSNNLNTDYSHSQIFNSSLKPDNVCIEIKDKDNAGTEVTKNRKTLSLLDLKSIPSVNHSNNPKLNQSSLNKDSLTINKLNLKTFKNAPEKTEGKEVVNYAGNKGKVTLNIPKLDMRNASTEEEKEKEAKEDINVVNIGHASDLKTNEELQRLERTIKDQNTTKIQLAFENMLKKKYNLFYRKATMQELTEEDLSNFNLFYLKERNNRLLYHDSELQVLIISLVMCLIITPTRGTLDELYCSYYPSYESNKMNILFLLHHHLNHQDNQEILPLLFKHVSEITPTGAGQRLMKLICISLFDTTIYSDWDKIGGGAYGQVFQCNTNLSEPSTVAIKKIGVAENIYDFCHIFDIFTEITALETFRMEGCVTHLFDYGVDSEYYYIVMKRYQMSLKEWRLQQTGSLNDMMPVYLNVFKDILKAVHSIHSYKTTHYDLKCDNVCIDLSKENDLTLTSKDNSDVADRDNVISVKIADFGECKMFLSEKDEYCSRSRGTNVIKSPEMLKNYGFQVRTDDDNYDRRKKMGTTRSSDIWSLGCLFYELLTGKFLFEEIETDYFGFMYKANTLSITELLTEDKLRELNNNPYLSDFLKFVLVKDMNYRPNIETIMKRFEHVHALLVSCGSTGAITNNLLMNNSKRFNANNVDQAMEVCNEMINASTETCNSPYFKFNPKDFKLKHIPNLIKITEEIYLADYSYTENNFDKLFKLGVTHIISWTRTKNKETEKVFYLNILENSNDIKKPIYFHLFKVMDFLRHCMVYRGIVLFVDDFQFVNFQFKPNFLIRNLIILCISFMLQLSAYDTWTYINSKLLFFWVPPQSLSDLSSWVLNQSQIFDYLFSHPVMKCLCGACVIIVKRCFSNINLMNVKTCTCYSKHKNTEHSECPSNGCYDYMQDIKKCYGLNYEYLQWGNFTQEDFIIGPGEYSLNGNVNVKKIVTCSRGLDDNLIQHSVNEKKSIKLTSKKLVWVIYKCRICQIWMYGEGKERYQLLINNIYNFNKKNEQKKLLIKSNHLQNLKLAKLL